jgi:alkyl sulfatase BDS1-like metallo-beta-lactamase superfamily hydrolase
MTGATDATRRRQEEVRRTLPFHDERDFEDARRGFVATLAPGVIHALAGSVAWDLDSFGFADEPESPDTVNPSLWRQFRLLMSHGLFEVVPGTRCGASTSRTSPSWRATRA